MTTHVFPPAAHATFRQRLVEAGLLTGTFLKAPVPIVTEWLGAIGYDFTVIDQEHGAFSREATDLALLAARAAGIAALVRTPTDGAEHILSALDGGAAGILVPHVQSAEQARAIVAAARYRSGRGFALSTRAAGYGQVPAREHVEQADSQTAVIVQIEDLQGLEHADAIASVDGIDAIFIGRGDLSNALGVASPNDPLVLQASARIGAAAKRHGKALSAFIANPAEAPALAQFGVSAFLLGTDQALLQQGAQLAARGLREALQGEPS